MKGEWLDLGHTEAIWASGAGTYNVKSSELPAIPFVDFRLLGKGRWGSTMTWNLGVELEALHAISI